MDDLAAQVADIFWRYELNFGHMGNMSEAELELATEPFRREISVLIAEHGREAVLRAALSLPGKQHTLN